MRRHPRPEASNLNAANPVCSRRDALRGAAGAAAMGVLGLIPGAAYAGAFARGSDVIRIGLIGCGGRGRGAVRDAVQAAEGVEIHALGDVFPDHLAAAREALVAADQFAPPSPPFEGGDLNSLAGCFSHGHLLEETLNVSLFTT